MDVSVQLTSGPADQPGMGDIGIANRPSLQPSGEVGVARFSDAFGRTQAGADSRFGVDGVIDRVRADFESFRMRMAADQDVRYVNSASKLSPPEEMTRAMNAALRSQMHILEVGVAFNAGLTATQQSQNGVKTLVEKA